MFQRTLLLPFSGWNIEEPALSILWVDASFVAAYFSEMQILQPNYTAAHL
jgi:hypothetical protein